jgi:hypothetical protein
VAVKAAAPGGKLFGAWLAGVGVNYAVVAWQAASLSRPGALEAELAGTDIRRELRRYSYLQFWVAVPLLFVVLAFRRPGGRYGATDRPGWSRPHRPALAPWRWLPSPRPWASGWYRPAGRGAGVI